MCAAAVADKLENGVDNIMRKKYENPYSKDFARIGENDLSSNPFADR